MHIHLPALRFFIIFLYILDDLHFKTSVISLDAPLWVIQRKRERYERNANCMKRQEWEMQEYGLQRLRAVVALQNHTLWLRCFECLHPDDSEELEDVWKPSPSIIGRKLQKFLKFIKDKIARSRKGKQRKKAARVEHLSKYRWEKRGLGMEDNWERATHPFNDDYENETMDRKQSEVNEFVDEIMSKDDDKDSKAKYKNMYIGDHLELEIRRLDPKKNTGWYRCVKRDQGGNNARALDISQLYFVDVLPERNITMRHVTSAEMKWSASQQFFKHFRLPSFLSKDYKVYGRTSEWTPCNKCGNRTGETRRTVECYIRRITNERLKNAFDAFAELPCQNSLLPQQLRKALPKKLFVVFEEYTECMSVCNPTRRTREIRNVTADDSDKPEVLDVLPPGEFTTKERLPPLPPPIIRRTIFANEDQPLQLDCSNQDGLALIWRKNFEELNGSRIMAEADDQWVLDERQRRQLTAEGRLIIEWVRPDDGGLYSCTAFPSGHILRTFRVYFVAGDRTKDLIEVLSLIFRALLFLYLLILMLDLLNIDVPNV